MRSSITEEAKMSVTDLKVKADDPQLLHIVGLYDPPRYGVRLFLTKLRYEQRDPADFKVTIIPWEGLTFAVATMPAKDKGKAQSVASQLGLELEDGVPHLASEGEEKWFPISSPNVFSLRASEKDARLLRHESQLIQEIERKQQ